MHGQDGIRHVYVRAIGMKDNAIDTLLCSLAR